MALATGTRIGDYEIKDLLGAGGMGEVYRARDAMLGRDVAIKVLPQSLAGDADRRMRFEREARTLAALNHPNIAQIYGYQQFDDTAALLLELVEGPTLAARLSQTRGQGLPVADAIRLAIQIARGLEAAHEKRVTHRDLKPANIKIATDGTVKVLDFGLAKLIIDDAPASSSEVTHAMHLTEHGMVLGTAPYMSPEQAIGAPVDHRTDIFAFGCVLFEMLCGARAFDGSSPSDIRARVVSDEPPWGKLPGTLPGRVRDILELCLAKDLNRRRQSIADVRVDLERAQAVAADPATKSQRVGIATWMVGSVATIGAVTMLLWPAREVAPPGAPELRVEIGTPRTVAPHEFALSPDGRTLVFSAGQLWLRSLESGSTRQLGFGGAFPFWSPDGRSIGFFGDGGLKRFDMDSGTQQLLAAAPRGRGGSWNTGDIVLFALQEGSPIQQVPAAGGEPRPATRLEAGHIAHRFPAFLPDGRHFVYFVAGEAAVQGIYLGTLDDDTSTRLAAADSAAAVLPPDRLAFNIQGVIVVRRLDLPSAALTGPTETLIDASPINPFSAAGISAATGGAIAYRAWSDRRILRWFDRSGTPLGDVGDADTNGLRTPRLSPDGRRLALDRSPLGNRDLWIRDLATGSMTRLTTARTLDGFPVWSPDGMRLAFHSDPAGSYDVYVKDLTGTAPEVPIIQGPGAQWPLDWSRDGRFLLFFDEAKAGDVRALPMTGPDRTPITIAGSAFAEVDAAVSPDSHWVAYVTNESGRFEIVVQSFPHAAAKWQVSTAGGIGPHWSANGRELYFTAPDATMMTVPVLRSAAAGLSFGSPAILFQSSIFGPSIASNRAEYDVSSDGRFLINEAFDDAQAPIQLVLNWRPRPQ